MRGRSKSFLGAVTWSQAKDIPSSAVLSENPDIGRAKLQWLKRHDSDCGNLYSMPPLIFGMLVALFHHMDRRLNKKILKGRIDYIDSWIDSEKEDAHLIMKNVSCAMCHELCLCSNAHQFGMKHSIVSCNICANGQ